MAVGSLGCASGIRSEPHPTTSPGTVIEQTGTVVFVNEDGGFWGIISDEGAKYRVTGLPASLQGQFLRVTFRGQVIGIRPGRNLWNVELRLIAVAPL